MIKKARIILRVSSDSQDEETQLPACIRRVMHGEGGAPWAFDPFVDVYRAHAVSGDDKTAPTRDLVFTHAQRGEFDVLVMWALDRWTGGRGGILNVFEDRERLRKLGVEMCSVCEPWLENDLLLAIAAWQGQQELKRKRARTREAITFRQQQIVERGGFWTKPKPGKPTRFVTKLGRQGNLTPMVIERAAAARASGLPWKDIAHQFRTTRGAIERAVARLKLSQKVTAP